MKRSLLTLTAVLAMTLGAVAPAFAKNTVDGACMATAVSARDTAVSTALQVVVTGIQTRGQALSAAWSGPADGRKAAVKAANTAFRGTWKTFNTARKSAWDAFKTAAKACHASSSDAGTPSSDAGAM